MAWKPDYVAVTGAGGLRSYLQITSADDDTFLGLWATTASRNVDGYCGRQFGKPDAPVTREYRGVYDYRCRAYVYVIDDLHDLTGLVVLDPDAVEVTDYSFEPVNALADGVPYQRMLCETGPVLTLTTDKFGWPSVPASIQTGLLLMAGRLAARRGSPFGIAGSPDDGSEVRLLARLDPDMIQVLKGGRFRRTWWAAR